MVTSAEAIEHTKKWIKDVVVGCNFCPFAANALKKQSIHYEVAEVEEGEASIEAFVNETTRLDEDKSIETVFLIFTNTYGDFSDYLDFVDLVEKQLTKNGYDGIYQVASFHPLYLFAGADEKDPANYTNRSVYPMLHLLRESSIDKVLETYLDPELIPDRNIAFARKKGLVYMNMLRDTCMQQ